MGAFLTYSIIGGFCMLAMFLTYRLLMAGDKQYGFNRAMLLLIYFVSFCGLPLLTYMISHAGGPGSEFVIPNVVVTPEAVEISYSRPSWGTVLIWTFMAGMVIVTLRTIVTWIRLIRVIRHGRKMECGGNTLVVTDEERFAPFSWMKYIVISRSDYENGSEAIIEHERRHIACRHWIDLLVAQVVCIINWFNPAAWLMREELMLVHEYQADMAVIASGHDVQEYQRLLIRKAVGARFPSLANSLNHSKLKKRITMMYKAKSGVGSRLKSLALVPMLALALGLAQVPAVRAAVSTISSSAVSVGKVSEKPSEDKMSRPSVQYFKVVNINNNDGKTTVVIKGEGLGNHLTVSGGTFKTKGKTYKANSLNTTLEDGKATITATFPFLTEFDKVSMTLNINGDEIPFNLEDFFSNAKNPEIVKAETVKKGSEVEVKVDTTPTLSVNGDKTSLKGVEIYLDGEKISTSELETIDPGTIESMSVDKKKNVIRITSKK